jgi:hypothetical protein
MALLLFKPTTKTQSSGLCCRKSRKQRLINNKYRISTLLRATATFKGTEINTEHKIGPKKSQVDKIGDLYRQYNKSKTTPKEKNLQSDPDSISGLLVNILSQMNTIK